jgi:hypothetical protein
MNNNNNNKNIKKRIQKFAQNENLLKNFSLEKKT